MMRVQEKVIFDRWEGVTSRDYSHSRSESVEMIDLITYCRIDDTGTRKSKVGRLVGRTKGGAPAVGSGVE